MSGKESTLGPRIRMKQKGEEYTSLDLREKETATSCGAGLLNMFRRLNAFSLSLSLSVRN
jgi:hypothetical protein